MAAISCMMIHENGLTLQQSVQACINYLACVREFTRFTSYVIKGA